MFDTMIISGMSLFLTRIVIIVGMCFSYVFIYDAYSYYFRHVFMVDTWLYMTFILIISGMCLYM